MFKRVPFNHIRKAARKVADLVHPEQIILFGSYAYGQPNADSDVDFLLVINKKSKKGRRTAFLKASDALDPRPFPVDLVVRSKSEIKPRIEQGDFFLKDIFQHGRILYQR